MNPYLLEKMLEEKHREMLADAARLQMLSTCRAHSGSRKDRLLAALGEYLVAAGERLINRHGYRIKMETDPTARA